jgi:hypothetical protein
MWRLRLRGRQNLFRRRSAARCGQPASSRRGGIGSIQTHFLDPFNLGHARIVDRDLYSAKLERTNLSPNQIQPLRQVRFPYPHVIVFDVLLHVVISLKQENHKINLYYVNRFNVLFLNNAKECQRTLAILYRK